MKMSAQDIWKHITHLITLWEDPWSPQNCSKIPKWKMRVVSAWVSRVQWAKNFQNITHPNVQFAKMNLIVFEKKLIEMH